MLFFDQKAYQDRNYLICLVFIGICGKQIVNRNKTKTKKYITYSTTENEKNRAKNVKCGNSIDNKMNGLYNIDEKRRRRR